MQRRAFLGSALGVGVATATLGPAKAEIMLAERDDAEAARRHDQLRSWVETPFGKIAYIEQGRGPAVLFLHGFPLSSFQWRGIMDRLAGERCCLAPDFLGLGRTFVKPGQALTPAAQVAMISAFLDQVNASKVDVIANDSGGAIAQLLVAEHSDRVRSLLLTNCDTEVDSPPAAVLPVIELARKGTYADLWLEPWVKNPSLARSPGGLGGLCYSNPNHPTDAAIGQYLAPLVASPQRKALVNAYALGLTPNPLTGIGQRLRARQTPARIVWGSADTIFGRQNVEYLRGVLPGLQGFREVPTGRLFFPEEHPDIVADEARRLWT